MNRREYKETLKFELYRNNRYGLITRLRIKYFSPNTNCMYMARKMWFLYSMGGVYCCLSKLIYLRIIRKYGCVIYPNASVGKGFYIAHPVGIVIGKSVIGENFTIYQNCTIGVKRPFDEGKGRIPYIGNNVRVCANAIILGDIRLCDDTVIAAGAVLLDDTFEPGVYAGVPARKVK